MATLCILNSMSEDELIKIGKIISAFGIRGQLKVYSEVLNFDKIKNFYKNKSKDRIEFTKINKQKDDLWIVKVKEIEDRNDAENLVGTEIFTTKSNFFKKNGEFFEFEVIGYNVFEEGANILIGNVENFMRFSHSKLMCIRLNNKSFKKGNTANGILYIDTRNIIKIENNSIIIKEIEKVIGE